MNHLSIRKATEDDLTLLAGILTEATQYKLKHGDKAWSIEPYTEDEVRPPTQKGLTYIAFIEDEVVGTFQLHWQDEMIWGPDSGDAMYAHQLAVRDGFHGQGLGQEIIEWALQETSNNGRQYLRIDFHPSNEGLKNYYESLGFKLAGLKQVTTAVNTYPVLLYQKSIK